MIEEMTFNEKQYQEALVRMTMLRLDKHCIKAFQNGEIWESEGIGALYELEEKEQQIVEDFKKEHPECLVYHLIHNKFEFGECYTILFVSNYEEEWKRDKEDIQQGYVFSYVKNVDYEDCSEFGTVFVKSNIGGLIRIS